MDEAAREVLRKFKPEIKKNLHLDDDILDTLEADHTLNGDLVQEIKANKTNSEKISHLLYILQRRGPGAFQAFIDAISVYYKFLADTLMDKYHEEERKLEKDSGNSSEGSLEPIDNHQINSNIAADRTVPVSNNQTILPQVGLNGNSSSNSKQDTSISNASTPQDENARKSSNHSLDYLVHPTNHHQYPTHGLRRTSTHSIDVATHQSLNGMYTKLKMHLFHMNEREQSFSSSPSPVTFEMVEDLLDKLLKLVHDCYKAIGANNKDSLLTSIINLKVFKSDLQKNLTKKEEQIQKYATKILKLETKCKNNDITMKQQENAIEALKTENKRLQEENEKLLKEVSMCKDVDESEEHVPKSVTFKQLSRQNEELKKKVSKYEHELHMMTPSKQPDVSNELMCVPSDNDLVTSRCNPNVKKATGSKKKLDTMESSDSLPSTLQECKELCAGTNFNVTRQNLQQMRTKILFAESKKIGSKKPKHAMFMDNIESIEWDEGQHTTSQSVNRENENFRRQYSGALINHEIMANKQGVSQNFPLKQKPPTQMKKTTAYKSAKKNPRWIRKPLK